MELDRATLYRVYGKLEDARSDLESLLYDTDHDESEEAYGDLEMALEYVDNAHVSLQEVEQNASIR